LVQVKIFYKKLFIGPGLYHIKSFVETQKGGMYSILGRKAGFALERNNIPGNYFILLLIY